MKYKTASTTANIFRQVLHITRPLQQYALHWTDSTQHHRNYKIKIVYYIVAF